jgi:hypothetical protein
VKKVARKKAPTERARAASLVLRPGPVTAATGGLRVIVVTDALASTPSWPRAEITDQD